MQYYATTQKIKHKREAEQQEEKWFRGLIKAVILQDAQRIKIKKRPVVNLYAVRIHSLYAETG